MAGRWKKWGCLLALAALAAPCPSFADSAAEAELRDRLRRVEENQEKLYELLKQKDERLEAVEAELRRVRQAGKPAPARPRAAATTGKPATAAAPSPRPPEAAAAGQPQPGPPPAAPTVAAESEPTDSAPGEATQPSVATTEPSPVRTALSSVIGSYEAGRGFALARTEWGEVNFGIYTYLRYLNQFGLDDTFTNGLGQEQRLDKRHDLELNKVKLEFRGWLIDPHFRYVLYTWTNNAAQGQGAQVVVGGNLNWRFGPELTLGGGILSLPSTRSTQGNFPNWLSVDHRTIADEFFRASYSQGFYGYGESHGFGYFGMVANNLSTLGVDAGQLDNEFSTVSTAVWWMPTTGEFGPKQGFGDYEEHEKLATRLGVHFTFSPEDRQSQPGTDDIDNTQIRLSNGTIVFTPGALGSGVSVRKVKYYMTDFDAGLKYRGFALEGEYYWRWLNDFKATGPLPEDSLFDHGFQLLASQMILSHRLQAYGTGSYIFGDRNDAWEGAMGFNYWVFARRELRLNLEMLYDHRSPVGYTAVPQSVGATGWVFNANLELSF